MEKKNDNNFEVLFYLLALVFYGFIVFLVTGCSSTPKVVERVRTEVKYEKTFVWDTMYVEIPSQSVEVTTRDTFSYLETDYAVSEARVLPNGFLSHHLSNKVQRNGHVYPKEVERRDSIVYRDKENIVEVEKVVYRKASLTWWQQTQIRGFWGLLVVVTLFLGVRYRTIVFTLFKRAVGLLR